MLFKFTPQATAGEIRRVTDAFRVLKDQVPGLLSFEHGHNTSLEGLNQGYNYVYVLTFADAGARDAYLPHPAHQQFGTFLGEIGVVESVFVADYQPAE